MRTKVIFQALSLLFFLSGLCYFLTAFKSPTRPTPQANEGRFENIKFFSDLFEYHTAIPLELTDRVVFDKPKILKKVNNGFFLTNDKGDELYRYHLDGTFDRTVAVKGSGPGEIGLLAYGTRIFDQQIAFWDLFQHSLHVFSEQGNWQFSLNFYNQELTDGTWLPTGVAFKWPSPETLVFSNISVKSRHDVQTGLCTMRLS